MDTKKITGIVLLATLGIGGAILFMKKKEGDPKETEAQKEAKKIRDEKALKDAEALAIENSKKATEYNNSQNEKAIAALLSTPFDITDPTAERISQYNELSKKYGKNYITKRAIYKAAYKENNYTVYDSVAKVNRYIQGKEYPEINIPANTIFKAIEAKQNYNGYKLVVYTGPNNNGTSFCALIIGSDVEPYSGGQNTINTGTGTSTNNSSSGANSATISVNLLKQLGINVSGNSGNNASAVGGFKSLIN